MIAILDDYQNAARRPRSGEAEFDDHQHRSKP
jgi:hypothetical protein